MVVRVTALSGRYQRIENEHLMAVAISESVLRNKSALNVVQVVPQINIDKCYSNL